MQNYQREFIEFAIRQQALCFGEFILKSGRKSPYFFNSGVFNTGAKLAKLGQYYAAAINSANIPFDMLFGPAYKGIPLVASAAIALAEHFDKDTPYAFNRKEKKDHGEGGDIIGATLKGRVLIIDDVITAGTAIRESITLMTAYQAQPAGIVIAVDRQERGQGNTSAIVEVEQTYHIPVISIIKFEQILQFLQQDQANQRWLTAMQDYRKQYGV